MNTDLTKEEVKKMIDEIPSFVFKKLTAILSEYKREENESHIISFETCPKCGIPHPVIKKGGITKKGKQMYRCSSCHKRFVEDRNEITFYSRLSKEQWNEAIKGVIVGDSIDTAASICEVTHVTAFKMRHKILSFLENNEDSIVVSDKVELDEKYIQRSHKGKKILGVEPRHRGVKASKRGISDEKICLLTAVERGGESFLRAYNYGRPSSEDVMNLKSHIKEGSYLWTDDHDSYNKLTNELGSKRVIVSSHKEYDNVNHLNTVNSFHSKIQFWYSRMNGVSSKYINRYAALFNIRWLLKGKDGEESLIKAKKRIKSLGRFVNLNWKNMGNTRIFNPEAGNCA